MAIQNDPSLQRRRLRVELRKARDVAKLTQRQAAERLEWSLSKLIRIEAGSVGISVTDLRAMLQLYDVTDAAAVKRLTEAARGSKGHSWWSRYGNLVSPQFAQYLGHENYASSIRIFHPFLIPGLMHTQEYAFELARPHLGIEQSRRIVDLRMKRQENLLSKPEPPDMAFILDEEALYRWIGGPGVMRRQLGRLIEISKHPGVSVHIVPFSAGAHPGLLGPFVLLGVEESSEEALFLEGPGGDLLSRDDQDKIVQYIEYFEAMRGLALPPDQARKLVQELIDQLKHQEGNGQDQVPEAETPGAAAELDPPEMRTGLADLGEVRWRSSSAGAMSLPTRAPIARTTSSACSMSYPATGTGADGSSRWSVSSSSLAALASRL